MTLAPGTVFAGFTIEKTLGVGGMGTVYLARHPRLPRSDALKLLRPELSYDPDFAERFGREADNAARLSHPNIVGVYDRGTEDGQLWISMQFVPGVDAEKALAMCQGPMPAQRAIRIVDEVAAALDFAHRNGLWHRDVKPANILLSHGVDDDAERVLLADFGIAKAADEARGLTQSGVVVGTFDYAPPEQIEGRPLDHRADTYALGCVLYRLLTGSVPYPGGMAAALNGHLNLPPPRPTDRVPWLAPELDDVVARAMAKDPESRFATCRALAQAARSVPTRPPAPTTVPYSVVPAGQDPDSDPAMPPKAAPAEPDADQTVRSKSPIRSGRRLVGVLAAALLVIGAGITAFILTLDDGRDSASGLTPATSAAQDADPGDQSDPPSSVQIGLPSGPPLADSVLVANQQIDGNLDLYSVDSISGDIQARLTSEAAADFGPVISPDRSSIVYLSQRGVTSELWVVASDGTGARPLFTESPVGCDSLRRPAWNPTDPRMLAVVCLDAAGNATLQLLTLDGVKVRSLEPGLDQFDDLAFSPDGESLLYWGNADPVASDGRLFVLATDGSAPPEQLTDQTLVRCADAVWSPDGTRIAFRASGGAGGASDDSDILVMASDGSEHQRLAPGEGFDQDPAWSPDGSMIVYKSDRADGPGVRVNRLWLMNADGSNLRLLIEGDVLDGFAPAWANR